MIVLTVCAVTVGLLMITGGKPGFSGWVGLWDERHCY